MKGLLFALVALFCGATVTAQSIEELQTKGDQLYSDGFSKMAWEKYATAFDRSNNYDDKIRLLNRLSKVAVEANRQEEAIEIIKRSTNLFNGQAKVDERAQLILNVAILKISLGHFRQAHEDCQKILSDLNNYPATLQNRVLQTIVYSLVKDSKPEEASKIIEKYRPSFQDERSADLENARIKIFLNQYVNAISLLAKYSDSEEPLAHFLSLWAYFKSGDINKAYEIYNKHLSKLTTAPDPAFTGVIIKVAESTFEEKGKEALILLDKIYEIEPDVNLKAYIALKKAELLLQSKLEEDTMAVLAAFLKDFPQSNKSLQVQVQLAELYYRSGKQDLAKATDLLNATIDANPQDKRLMYKAFLARAAVKQAAGSSLSAAADYKNAALLAHKEKFSNDKICYPLYQAGVVHYAEADKKGVKQAFNDAADSFDSAASVKSSYRLKAALMQIQALRRSEAYTQAINAIKHWQNIFPSDASLEYLLGVTLIEDQKILAGVSAINSFIAVNKGDQRIPMAYVTALRAVVYSGGDRLFKEGKKLIMDFEMYEKTMKEDDPFVKEASTYMKHLKAIFFWKNNDRFTAEKLWLKLVQDDPDHPLAAEACLWLAFKARTSQNKNIHEAIKFYQKALPVLKKNPLKAYTLIQLGKSYKDLNEFERALESLEAAIDIYQKNQWSDSLATSFVDLLFYTGDLYSRVGLYEEKAITLFRKAEQLTPLINTQLALRGRVADCLFSAAGPLRNQDDKKTLYENKIRQALALYKGIYDHKNSSKVIGEQALYKMAKCYEVLGNLKEKTSSNKELADARTYYHEVFFGFKDDFKRGLRTDPYFFCRTGYDLGRMLLSYDEKNIQSAISTYQVLADSGFAGTRDAGQMVKILKDIQRSTDD